jgi:D-glycero-alpha-D-manno-heptose-7-phosphate kinase
LSLVRTSEGNARRLIVRAPVRLDFGGGWTDVPPYADAEGGYVCNVAVTPYATVELGGERRPSDAGRDEILAAALASVGAGPVAASVTSDFPVGAGLGGSSAVGVAAAAAALLWSNDQAGLDSLDRAELAERSRRTEVETLGVAGGRQDHYAAAFGGALGLAFDQGHVDVRRISLMAEVREALERRLTVIYTGQSRISGTTISAVMDAYERGDDRTIDTLAAMKSLARAMADALAAGDVDRLGSLVGEHWTHQRELHPAIPTARIDAIIAAAAAAGSIGAKALGASGGGCVLVVAPESAARRVRAAVSALGEVVPFRIDERGVEVVAS